MDRAEARPIALQVAGEVRAYPYEYLVEKYLDQSERREMEGRSGVTYFVVIQAMWDSRKAGDLRVRVLIDDGGWRAFSPLVEDFIVAPDSRLIGD